MKKKIFIALAMLFATGAVCVARTLITVNTSCGKVAYLDAGQLKTSKQVVEQALVIDDILCK